MKEKISYKERVMKNFEKRQLLRHEKYRPVSDEDKTKTDLKNNQDGKEPDNIGKQL